MKYKGCIINLDPNYGNGGIGYIVDEEKIKYFFHSSYVKNNQYKNLTIGKTVIFRRIRARSAMGAGPQARDIEIKK